MFIYKNKMAEHKEDMISMGDATWYNHIHPYKAINNIFTAFLLLVLVQYGVYGSQQPSTSPW